MTSVIGIDPGLTGALARVEHGMLTDVVDMPVVAKNVDPWALAAVLVAWGPVHRVAVEQQQAYPRQGVSSAFKGGVGYGQLLGVLAVLERPLVIVTAGKWTAHHRVGADKGLHRRRAMELWPAMADRFARVRDDGRADAALIAAWAAETSQGHKENVA